LANIAPTLYTYTKTLLTTNMLCLGGFIRYPLPPHLCSTDKPESAWCLCQYYILGSANATGEEERDIFTYNLFVVVAVLLVTLNHRLVFLLAAPGFLTGIGPFFTQSVT
jgi:hypothetical protein